jgi:hypothetical protein
MAEEMSGREPTFCCSKESFGGGEPGEGLRSKNEQRQKPLEQERAAAKAFRARTSNGKSLWSKNEQQQKPIRGFFASLRMTNKERARAKTETEADSLRE